MEKQTVELLRNVILGADGINSMNQVRICNGWL